MTGRVKPIDVEPEPPRRGIFLVVASVVVLVGFGLFLATGNLSVSAPTTTADPPRTSTTTTTEPSGATPEVAAAPELRTLVPGFQGRVRAVVSSEDGNPAGWWWASGESEPRIIDLPLSERTSWAPDVALLATIGESSFGRSLFFGPPTNIREVFNDVEDFAWHTTQPAALAFVTAPQADGMRELWRSLPASTTVSEGTFNASRVMRFDFEARLVAYGDWGFAMESISAPPADPIQLSTFDPEGNPIATAPAALAADFGDGRLLVVVDPGSNDPRLAITGTDLGDFEFVGPEGSQGGLISPNKLWVASSTLSEPGATLVLTSLEDRLDRAIRLGVDIALPVAWSEDGRWILLIGSPDAPASNGTTQLIFVRTPSEDISVLTTLGTLSGFALDTTGAPGPNTFSEP